MLAWLAERAAAFRATTIPQTRPVPRGRVRRAPAVAPLCGVLLTLIFFPMHVYAATVTVDFSLLGGWINPLVADVVPVLAVGIFGWLAAVLKQKWGVDIKNSLMSIEARHRSAYQSALRNAAGFVIAHIGANGKIGFDVANPVLASAINLLIAGVPDAVKAFGLTPEKIARDIIAHLPQISPEAAATPFMPAPAAGLAPVAPAAAPKPAA
jgi:hypothetical protein